MSLQQEGEAYLNHVWAEIQEEYEINSTIYDVIGKDWQVKIYAALTGGDLTYHYVLPTQLLAKSVNPALDARSLKAKFQSAGAFDARTLAHKVIVPFDAANHMVLGGSSEPYVNNPLRVDGITEEHTGNRRSKKEWKNLIDILDHVEKDETGLEAPLFLRQTLIEILRLSQDAKVVYPAPARVSLAKCLSVVDKYLSEKSGGERPETLATALLRVFGKKTNYFDKVERDKVNAADKSSGRLGDIECYSGGQIVLLTEVKEQKLTITQFEASREKAREGKIRELLFITQLGLDNDFQAVSEERQGQEFSSGQNIYFLSIKDFCPPLLIILGEFGRSDFLREVGAELDKTSAAIKHRKAWALLLKNI